MSMSVPGNSCRPCNSTSTTSGCQFRLPGQCVYYSGSSISGPGINPGDNFNTVVNKLVNNITPPFVLEAVNGLSVSNNKVVFGQNLNDVTNPAILLSSREIPNNGNFIYWTGIGKQSMGYSDTTVAPFTILDVKGSLGVTVGTAGYATSGFNSNVGAVMHVSHQGSSWGLTITKSGAATANFGALLTFYRTAGATANTRTGLANGQPIGSIIYQAPGANNTTVGTAAGIYCRVASSSGGVVRGYIELIPASSAGFITSVPGLTLSADNNLTLGLLTSTGESDFSRLRLDQILTGTQAYYGINLTTAWNTTGAPTAINANIADTASDATSLLMNLQLANNSIFKVSKTNVGIGMGASLPSARLHLPAGTASASSAPLKLTAGTNLTAPEDGVFEFDGTNLYFTVGGTRKVVSLV